jgi:hypothetical protein
MAIVQSCQVQMIKNLEVVGAFSAKKFFPEKIIFDDLPPFGTAILADTSRIERG